MATQDIKEVVKQKYGEAARRAAEGGVASCCTALQTSGGQAHHGGQAPCCDPISSNLYGVDEVSGLPKEALGASLGCGNPTALAELRAGEMVLDLGSGGGIDVLLSARRVGPTGKAYGLDMTDEMLELARENQRKRNACGQCGGEGARPARRNAQLRERTNLHDAGTRKLLDGIFALRFRAR